MRLLTCILSGFLITTLGLRPAAAQDPAPDAPAASGPTAIELIEDLRILSILNVLQPSREQSTKLAAVAVSGKEGLAAIEAEVKAKLAQQRGRLLGAREKLLRGGDTPRDTDELLGIASRSAEATRAQKMESLIRSLSDRVRGILTREQAVRIESDLAPSFDQPWRRYGRVLNGPTPAARAGGRMPVDPGKWLKELRDLRIDSAEGDPAHEVEDFGKKMTRGLRSGTPLFEQAFNQARAFATQVLAMPPDVFTQREWGTCDVAR